MEPDKTQFHEEMGKWESDFADFKKLFPKNYGAMVRKYLPLFLILMSIILFCCAFIEYTELSLILFLISPVMFILGVVLWRKPIVSFLRRISRGNVQGNDLTTANYLNLQKQISTAEHDYSIYPDVMEYLKQFKTSVEAKQRHKKSIKRNFWIIFCGFFVVCGLTQYHNYKNKPYNHGKLRNFSVQDNICRVLELEDYAPLLILGPYKTNIDDSITIESKFLSVFLDYDVVRFIRDKDHKPSSCIMYCLTAKRPIVVGGTGILRLTITDENGNPIPRCPCFVFDPNVGDEIISSEFFLYTPKVSDALSDLQTIETLRYLQANQEHLRFIVEKI